MALSGSFKGTYGKGWHIRTDWSATQNIADNTSTITCKHYLDCDNYYSIYIGNRSNTSVIDGKSYTFDSPSISNDGNGAYSKHVGTTSRTISHNADGSKSFSMSTKFYLKATLSGVYVDSVSASSGTITLDKIPRQANITAAPNFTDEGNPSITYSNPAGNAVNSLQACISLTGATDDIKYRDIPKTGSSYTFTLSDAERTLLRNNTSGNSRSVTFYVKTVIGSNTYYSTLTKTLSIVNANPTLNPTVYDSNAAMVALTGDNSKFVKYYSDATFTVGAAALKGASIKSRSVTCGSKSSTAASGTLQDVESAVFVFNAKDSRGNPVSKTLTKTLIDYVKLTCNLDAENPTAEGDMRFEVKGNYFNGSFGATANTLQVQYRYKENNGAYGDWITLTPSLSGNSYSITVDLEGLNYQSLYTFEARAIDKVTTIPSGEKKVKTTPVFDWGENDFHIHGDLFVEGIIQSNAAGGDTVIESGNNGSYAYRKWSSGLMEAWRSATSTVSVTSSGTSGALYFTDQVALTTNGAAAQFVSLENVQVTVNKVSAIGLWQPVIARTRVEGGAASADVFFINSTKDATVSIVPYIYFIGRWK